MRKYDDERDMILARSEIDPISGCWEWSGSRNPKGYGTAQFRGRGMNAHRVSYLAFMGPIGPGLCVCHVCDNPGCVNPEHLWLGTYKENWHDCRAKGRETSGERNGRSKLTHDDILRMRLMYALNPDRTQQVIASLFGVSRSCVCKIVNRKAWFKDVRP